MDKISIILPVYNGEQFLIECLESIRNQTYFDFEVIAIDDCSTDSTNVILQKYAKEDPRFIYKRNDVNGGLSYSRNVGISLASGKYLFFIDADDAIDENCLQKMMTALVENKADVSISDFAMFETHIEKHPFETNVIIYDNQSLMKELAICSKIQNFTWGKLYKAELFKGVQFPIGRYFEDICTTPLVLAKASKGVFVSEKLYFYRQNPNSISKTLNIKKISDFFLSMEEKGNYIFENYTDILKYMSQSFFELFYLLKDYKIKKQKISNYKATKRLYKMAAKKSNFKQKIKYFIAVL